MGKLKQHNSPNLWAGGYEFHAYCKWNNPDHDYFEFPHIANDVQTLPKAMAQLRSHGWIFHKDHTATCPKCRAALKDHSHG